MFNFMKKRKQKQDQKANKLRQARTQREIEDQRRSVEWREKRLERMQRGYLEVGSLCESGNFKAAANAGGHSFDSSVSNVLERAASIFHKGDHVIENHRIKAKDATAEAGVICRRMIRREKEEFEAAKKKLASLKGRAK